MKLGTHPSDDDLELYSLGQLDEQRTAPLEEHLLVCEACQARVGEFDEYVHAMRAALREAESEQQVPRTSLLARLLAIPKPVWAGAMAAVLALVFLVPWQPRGGEPFGVELQALRGAARAGAVAPAERPLALIVDLTGLELGREYRLEVVDSAGDGVWRGTVRPTEDKTPVALGRGLGRGQYWVRIYDAAPPSGELLREFGLSVE